MNKAYTPRKKRKKQSSCLPVIIVTLLLVTAVWIAAGRFIEHQQKLMYPQKYSEYVDLYSKEYNVPADIIYSVIRTESGFDPNAVSRAGAVGLMQITPDTYNWLLYVRKEEKESELADPETCIDFGVYFLSYLYKKFGNWDTVFAAYNAGMNRVSEWLCDERYAKDGELIYIPYSETSNYVKKVNNTRIKYKQLYENSK